MPPPVTPSPHRFVIKNQPPVRKTHLVQNQTISHSTQQFNTTPRFNFSSTPQPTPLQQLPASTPSAALYLTPARPVHRHEEIDSNYSDGLQDAQDSIETEEYDANLEYLSEDEDNTEKIEEPSPKRRRLSSSVGDDALNDDLDLEIRSSPPPTLSSPPNTRRPVSGKTPRFIIASPANPSTLRDPQSTFIKPPRFRPPEPADQALSPQDPLPDQFSPHRRGQKYTPGGLAAGVRDWLMNIEFASPANGPQKKNGMWLLTLVVQEVSGDSREGITMVMGSQDKGSAAMKVLLAGEGEGTGLQKGAMVEVGRTVGIKGTVWDVVIEGEKWGVCVDWKVLPW